MEENSKSQEEYSEDEISVLDFVKAKIFFWRGDTPEIPDLEILPGEESGVDKMSSIDPSSGEVESRITS